MTTTLNSGGRKLQELALAHADEGTLEDFANSNALSTDTAVTDKGYFFSVRLAGTLFSLGFAVSASYFAFSPPAAVLSYINADIGPSDNASLFTIIWSTCCAIGILLFGRISDKFGRRWIVVGASCVALIGGIIAATAQTMNTLIGAQVPLGLAAGVHTCYGLTVGEVCPNKYKGIGVAAAAVFNVISTGFGAYIGLSLVHYHSWRYIYYIFIPLMALVVVTQFIFYYPPTFQQLHGGKRTVKQELKRVDFLGIFLIVAGLILFLLGVSWGGQPLSWSSPTILGLIITGGCLIIIFVLWELYGSHPNPIVPMHYFLDVRGFVCLIIICAVAGTSFVALSIIWPSQVLILYTSPTTSWQRTAWLSTTIAFAIYVSIILGLPLVAVIKHVRAQLVFLMLMMIGFTGAMASCNTSNMSQSAALSFFAGFPAGILELTPVILIQLDVTDADLGVVFSIIYSIRAAVGSIMTSVYIAILTSKVKTEIGKYVPAAALKAGLPASSLPALFGAVAAGTPEAMSQVPGITPAIETAVGGALSKAYPAAYAYVYYAAMAVQGVALIAAICVKDYDGLFNNHVSRQIYNRKTRKLGGGAVQNVKLEEPVAGDMEKQTDTEVHSAAAEEKWPSTTMVE